MNKLQIEKIRLWGINNYLSEPCIFWKIMVAKIQQSRAPINHLWLECKSSWIVWTDTGPHIISQLVNNKLKLCGEGLGASGVGWKRSMGKKKGEFYKTFNNKDPFSMDLKFQVSTGIAITVLTSWISALLNNITNQNWKTTRRKVRKFKKN